MQVKPALNMHVRVQAAPDYDAGLLSNPYLPGCLPHAGNAPPYSPQTAMAPKPKPHLSLDVPPLGRHRGRFHVLLLLLRLLVLPLLLQPHMLLLLL